MSKASNPLFAFLGSTRDSRYALEQLERLGLSPALVVSDKELPQELYNTEWDFLLVASYGKILKKDVLGLPRHGCLNIHPSLLPKFRGPSPYRSAILADERQTGVSLMVMTEGMDAGPLLAQARVEIAEEEWPPPSQVLSQMLFVEGANLLAEALGPWMDGSLVPQPQDDAEATYTKKFSDEDSLIDLAGDARHNFLKIRAFDTDPRAHFFIYPEHGGGAPKRVIVTEAEYNNGKLEILRVLPEGRREMSYEDFKNGLAGRAGIP